MNWLDIRWPKGSSIHDVTWHGGGSAKIDFITKLSLIKHLVTGAGGQKRPKFIWHHVWTIPKTLILYSDWSMTCQLIYSNQFRAIQSFIRLFIKVLLKQVWKTFSFQARAKGYNAICYASAMQVLCKCYASAIQVLCKC